VGGGGLGGFSAIPDILELEAKSNVGATWVKMMQDGLQKFSEAAKVSVFVGVEQPANFGDKWDLDGMGVDIMAKILQIGLEAFVEVFLGGVVGHQNTDIHLVLDALGAKTLKVLADSSIGLPEFVWFIQHFFVEG